MKITGSIVPFADLEGQVIKEVGVYAAPTSPVISLKSESFEWIFAAVRTCCQTFRINQVIGDIDFFLESQPIDLVLFDAAGDLLIAGQEAPSDSHLLFEWRSDKKGDMTQRIKLRKRRI
jgi:hypothetical protein